MTENYQTIIQLHDAFLSAVERGDNGAELERVLGIPVEFNPRAHHEFFINNQPYFYDDSVVMAIAGMKGINMEDSEVIMPLFHEAFENHDADAAKVIAFLFDRMEYHDVEWQEVNGSVRVWSDLNGPHGTVDDLAYLYWG